MKKNRSVKKHKRSKRAKLRRAWPGRFRPGQQSFHRFHSCASIYPFWWIIQNEHLGPQRSAHAVNALEAGARVQEGIKQPRQSICQRRIDTADERSPALFSAHILFIPQLKTTSDSPKPASRMMLKLACLLGVLVCGSQGRVVRVRVRVNLQL